MVQCITSHGAGRQNFAAMAIHIGAIIQEYMELNHILITDVAKKLGVHRNTVTRILSRSSMDSQMLLRISRILKQDFFTEYSKQLSAAHTLSEPHAEYKSQKPTTTRIIIELPDGTAQEQQDAAVSIVERIRGKEK